MCVCVCEWATMCRKPGGNASDEPRDSVSALCVCESVCVLGLGNVGCLAWCIVRGRQSRSTRPRWLSGQHLFHLLAGSYQQQRCHTHWMRKKRGILCSLRKHACLCLSCKQTLGPLSGSAFAFHKADGVPVVSDHILAVCAML